MRLNALCDKERQDSENVQFRCSKTHRKTSYMLSVSIRHLSKVFSLKCISDVALMTWKFIVKFWGRSAHECPCRAPTSSRTSLQLRGRQMRVSHHKQLHHCFGPNQLLGIYLTLALLVSKNLPLVWEVFLFIIFMCLNNCPSSAAKVSHSVREIMESSYLDCVLPPVSQSSTPL